MPTTPSMPSRRSPSAGVAAKRHTAASAAKRHTAASPAKRYAAASTAHSRRAAARPTPADGPIRYPNLPLLLLQARERVLAQFRPLLNAHGVTEQQWRIVRALLETGPLEPRQIVALCGISSPSLAGVLARMEELGLVQRERLDHDQRRQLVSLTPASKRLAARIAPEVEATYQRLEARLGTQRVADLIATLDEWIGLLGPSDEEDETAVDAR
jgi:homoprotocatechuate degradation regulator HpaR